MSDLITRAIEFALEAHAGQKYGDLPFWIHPAHVAEVAEEYGLAAPLVAAAWLHDTMEDCEDVTPKALLDLFGPDVAFLVWAVTNEPGTRKERHPATYAKIRQANYLGATAVKLCDRIANAEHCLTPGGRRGLLKMYRKEYAEFKEALQKEGEHAEMWERLDKLMRKGA